MPTADDVVVQECGAGLVTIRRVRGARDRLAFAAPPLMRSGPVDEADLERIAAVLRVDRADLLEAAWIDNGPGWVGVLLEDARGGAGARPGLGRLRRPQDRRGRPVRRGATSPSRCAPSARATACPRTR